MCRHWNAADINCYILPRFKNCSPPNDVPKTRVGHDSIRAVRPLRKIWWRNKTVSLLRNIELISSWVQGGFLLLAAILKGLRKHEMRISSCSTYSSSASTMRNTKLLKRHIKLGFWWQSKVHLITQLESNNYTMTSNFHFRRSQKSVNTCTFIYFYFIFGFFLPNITRYRNFLVS